MVSEDLDWGGELLGQAFVDDPLFQYVIPNDGRRSVLVPWFLKTSLAYAFLYGEAYATEAKDGLVYILPPGENGLKFFGMLRTGMLSAPLKLGSDGTRRFLSMAKFMGQIHKRKQLTPHLYVFGMGVAPSAQGKGLGTALMQIVLKKMATDNLPCYLETQNARNVAFYRKHGFDVVVEAPMPNGDLRTWGMWKASPSKAT